MKNKYIPDESKIILLLNFIWRIAFNQTPSQEVTSQIKKFLFFGTGMMVAKFLSITSQIIMGRKFGPEIYGQITLILLISSYFAMPMVNGWGLVFTKIAAKETDSEKKHQALKSLLIVVSICCILTMIILAGLQKPLAKLLGVTVPLMQLSLVMTFFYAWWILAKQIAQGFQDWYTYVVIENIWAVVVLAGILGLILLAQFNLVTVSEVFFAGYFLSGIGLFGIVWRSLFAKVNLHYIQDILSHGWFLLLNGLVGVATFSIDRILINKNLGVEEVGIYQAHFLSTYGIVSAFMTILLTYIFPAFCRNNDMHVIIGKIIKIQYPATIIISIVTGSLVLWMYSFPVSFTLFGSLCLFNAVQFHVQLKSWYLASKGINESKRTLLSQLVFLSTNVFVLLILIQYISIIAGGISLLIAACSSLFYLSKSEITIPHETTF